MFKNMTINMKKKGRKKREGTSTKKLEISANFSRKKVTDEREMSAKLVRITGIKWKLSCMVRVGLEKNIEFLTAVKPRGRGGVGVHGLAVAIVLRFFSSCSKPISAAQGSPKTYFVFTHIFKVI